MAMPQIGREERERRDMVVDSLAPYVPWGLGAKLGQDWLRTSPVSWGRYGSSAAVEKVLATLAAARSGATVADTAGEVHATTELHEEISSLKSDVEKIGLELKACKETIDRLGAILEERPITKHTMLFSIDEKLEVVHPVPIVIEDFADEVVASFPEVEIFGVGDNEPEAICNLKSEIVDLYYELVDTPKDTLGRLPLSWLEVLQRLIRKRGDS